MIERYNKLIGMSVMADFLMLGHETVGSFALADSKTTMFARSVGAVLDVIAEQFNRVLLPRLWAWNGFDVRYLPTLAHGDIEQRNLTDLAAYVTSLAGAGMPLFPDPVTENFLREQAGLPPLSEDALSGAQAANPSRQPGQLGPGQEPGQLGPGQEPGQLGPGQPGQEDEEEMPDDPNALI
jgi:hypothetical protein